MSIRTTTSSNNTKLNSKRVSNFMLLSVLLITTFLCFCNINLSSFIQPIEGQKLPVPSDYFSKILPNVLMDNKKTLSAQRAKRIDEISKLATNYLEMEEMLGIEEKMQISESAIQNRKTKIFNIASLINTLTSEVQLIDRYCEDRVGQNCEIPTCFGKYQDGTQVVCGGHGKCLDVDTCQCDNGFTGSECLDFGCFGYSHSDLKTCSGNGICVASDVCNCRNGFFGKNCSQTVFSGSITYSSNDGYRSLSNSNIVPKTCKEYYLNYYTGNVGDGLYLVKPKDRTIVVYCNMKAGGWTLVNEILWVEANAGNQISVSADFSTYQQKPLEANAGNQISISADLSTYRQKPLRLSKIIASDLMKDFKGSYYAVKNGYGLRCTVGSDDPTNDPILNYLCLVNNRNGLNTFVAATYSSYMKYWLY